jgi:hypothetical protein
LVLAAADAQKALAIKVDISGQNRFAATIASFTRGFWDQVGAEEAMMKVNTHQGFNSDKAQLHNPRDASPNRTFKRA